MQKIRTKEEIEEEIKRINPKSELELARKEALEWVLNK